MASTTTTSRRARRRGRHRGLGDPVRAEDPAERRAPAPLPAHRALGAAEARSPDRASRRRSSGGCRVPSGRWRELLYHGFELVQFAQRKPARDAADPEDRLAAPRRSVARPGLREALTPNFTLGCKRILLSNDYYPALTTPNVEVVAQGVEEVADRTRSTAADGIEREVDTIIFGTGFHATDPPIAERVRGRDGRVLGEVWRGSPQAYIGTTVAGFPNDFMIDRPQPRQRPHLGDRADRGAGALHRRRVADDGSARAGDVEPRARRARGMEHEVQEALAGRSGTPAAARATTSTERAQQRRSTRGRRSTCAGACAASTARRSRPPREPPKRAAAAAAA